MVYVSVSSSVPAYVCVYTCVYTRVCTLVHTNVHGHVCAEPSCMYTCTHSCMNTCTCTHTHTHTRACTHTHTRRRRQAEHVSCNTNADLKSTLVNPQTSLARSRDRSIRSLSFSLPAIANQLDWGRSCFRTHKPNSRAATQLRKNPCATLRVFRFRVRRIS